MAGTNHIGTQLLSKHPDTRYQSAHGLQTDLLECQRRLLATVSSASEESSEVRNTSFTFLIIPLPDVITAYPSIRNCSRRQIHGDYVVQRFLQRLLTCIW